VSVDYPAFAAALIEELSRHQGPVQQGRQLVGSSHVLTSDGTAVSGVTSSQAKAVVEFTGPPKSYIIATRGTIEQPALNLVETFAAASFEVIWACAGLTFRTLIDGLSDQFLSIQAEQVQVFAQWDDENIRRMPFSPRTLSLPQKMTLAAACIPSDGAVTQAHRTILVRVGASGTDNMPIPYGARGFRVITASTVAPSYYVLVVFSQKDSTGIFIDTYNAAALVAGHDRGEYLAIPSMADLLTVNYNVGPAPANPGFVEFLLEP
jgi:hypothetical protein